MLNSIPHMLPPWVMRLLHKRRLLLWRLAIIPAVLLFSFVLAYKLRPPLTHLVIIAPFLFVGILVLIRWPAAGLLLLVGAGLAFPEEIIHQLGLITLIVMGLTGLWVFDMFVREKELRFLYSRPVLALFALVVVATLAFLSGQLPWYPVTPAPIDAQVGGILIFAVVALIFTLAANQITDVNWLKWITFAFLGLGGLYVLGRMFPPLGRLFGSYLFTSYLGGSVFWIWMVAMATSQAFYNKKLAMPLRYALGGIAVGTLYVVLFQSRAWVSGWLPSLIALGMVIFVGVPRAAIAMGVVALTAAISQFQYIVDNFLYVGDNQYSQVTRLEAWRIIGEIVQVNPLLGLGPANYSFYTPLFPILGWQVQFNSHNNYVDLVAQTGILGLLCFLWFLWEMGKVLLHLWRRVEGEGFERAYVYGAIGGFVATAVTAMLGDWVIPYVYNITIRGLRASMLAWLFLGGAVALNHILAHSTDSKSAVSQ